MSGYHNSREGELLAIRFHKFCAWVGVVHIGIGLLAMGWHFLGVKDHERNLGKMCN